jgi:predicted transcriptional regulator
LRRLISVDKQALKPDDTLRRAGEKMRSLQAAAWPVVKDHVVIGMIEGPNPDWRAQRYGHDPDKSVVSACMHLEVPHCYDDEDCSEVLEFMLSRHLRYVPVTDRQERFVGIVSLDDVLAALDGTDAAAAAHRAVH